MATYTSIINSVLRRLRENTVAGPTSTTYATLIGELVNETKREVEDAWKWTALRQTVTINTVAGTTQYAITGAGKRFKLQDKNFSVYNSTDEAWLKQQSGAYLKPKIINAGSDQGTPIEYYFEGVDSSGDPYVNVFNKPDGIYAINFNLIIPQAELSNGADVLTISEWPIILGTYAKAIAERGEDNGKTHGEALNKYAGALSDAIAMDVELTVGEMTWYA